MKIKLQRTRRTRAARLEKRERFNRAFLCRFRVAKIPKSLAEKTGAYMRNAKGWLSGMVIAFMSFMWTLPAYASDIGSSKLATGTEKLVNDVTTWLLVIAPLITVVAVIYYFIRKAVSDEMDHKKWNTRISTAVISCIGVVLASVIIKVIVAYYQ